MSFKGAFEGHLRKQRTADPTLRNSRKVEEKDQAGSGQVDRERRRAAHLPAHKAMLQQGALHQRVVAAIRLPGSCPPITRPVVGAAEAGNHPLTCNTQVAQVKLKRPTEPRGDLTQVMTSSHLEHVPSCRYEESEC